MAAPKLSEVALKQVSPYLYLAAKTGGMQVPLKIYASPALMEKMKTDNCLQQGLNVASCLPGIVGASIMLPDAHVGYGFSIGGVAAFDAESGCITPGGIGFDINCGVRLLSTNLAKEQVEPKIKELLEALFRHVPSGVGRDSFLKLTDSQLNDVLKDGAHWAVKEGYGLPEDIEHTEEGGRLDGAVPQNVSAHARARGRSQLGTLGAGNHFLEVQIVDEIYDEEAAKAMGLFPAGQIAVMVHCGSRGLGHQVCSDFLRKMEDQFPEIWASLPEKDLIYAPAQSAIAKEYFGAMNAAANFAWANRQIIAHQVRKAFERVFPDSKLALVYDVCHNIAKLEEHDIDGAKKKVFVHRKGATRAFPPGHPQVPAAYKAIGQPVLIPGSMGTASYVLAGTETAMQQTFGSSAHGAGRVMSRFAAKNQWRGETLKAELEAQHIYVKAASWKGITEEAPGAYKDISEVVRVTEAAGIGRRIVKLRPLGVVKG